LLSAPERDALLRVARASITGDREAVDAVARAERDHPALAAERATFVTLETIGAGGDRELRGCVGTIEPAGSIARATADNAIRAAFHDPRFAPVAADELPSVRISVSVLEPPTTVRGPREVIAGTHGVILIRGPYRALFLPQVAREAGWDVATLLAELSRKAGLPKDGWRDATLQVFGAESFGEP